jgi:hypothetical protein
MNNKNVVNLVLEKNKISQEIRKRILERAINRL